MINVHVYFELCISFDIPILFDVADTEMPSEYIFRSQRPFSFFFIHK